MFMFFLIKPLNLAKLVRQHDGLLANLVCFDDDLEHVHIKQIASLSKLLEPYECSSNNSQEYSLGFVAHVDENLSKLKRTVLIAPKNIVSESHLDKMISRSNIVLAVDNPRLEFIKLASVIETQLEGQSISEEESSSVVYGKNCLVKDGAVIGKPGFGFERDLDGTPIRFPHFGGVVLGNNVEVGANTVISRGVFEDTEIGDSTKIDDLVYIAHNCKIGENVMIAGNATLCGGVQVGDSAWIGAGASVKQNIKVGDGAIVGMGAVVTRNVSPGSTVAGNPARTIESKDQEKQKQGTV